MNHPVWDFYVYQTRRQDDLTAAAHSRLVKEASEASPRPTGVRGLTPLAVMLTGGLAWLGSLLINWSCALQSRYAIERKSRPCTNA